MGQRVAEFIASQSKEVRGDGLDTCDSVLLSLLPACQSKEVRGDGLDTCNSALLPLLPIKEGAG